MLWFLICFTLSEGDWQTEFSLPLFFFHLQSSMISKIYIFSPNEILVQVLFYFVSSCHSRWSIGFDHGFYFKSKTFTLILYLSRSLFCFATESLNGINLNNYKLALLIPNHSLFHVGNQYIVLRVVVVALDILN